MEAHTSEGAADQVSVAAFVTRWSGAACDDVPPLDSLPEQLHALTLGQRRPAAPPPAAAAPPSAAGQARSGQAPGVRRGFFDSKPAKQQQTQQRSSEEAVRRLVSLPPGAAAAAGKQIPDALKLPPDSQFVRRSALVGALQPSQDMMATILGSPELVEAFDDSAVMSAVSEVAADPAAFAKHAHNPKVRAFYDRMSKVAAQQLERAGVTPDGRAQPAAEPRAQDRGSRPRITELT